MPLRLAQRHSVGLLQCPLVPKRALNERELIDEENSASTESDNPGKLFKRVYVKLTERLVHRVISTKRQVCDDSVEETGAKRQAATIGKHRRDAGRGMCGWRHRSHTRGMR